MVLLHSYPCRACLSLVVLVWTGPQGGFEAQIPFRECLFGQNTFGIPPNPPVRAPSLVFTPPPARAVIPFLLLQYFTSRLKDPPTGAVNQTVNGTLKDGDSRSVLESKFNNVMTLCAMVPLLIFTCLNSFIHQR